MTGLVVALGAAAGALTRFLLSRAWDTDRVPRGTWTANMAGSFGLGLLVGAGVQGQLAALAGIGFCGALTTYSSFAVQARHLGGRRGTLYAVLTVAGSLAVCGLGYALTA